MNCTTRGWFSDASKEVKTMSNIKIKVVRVDGNCTACLEPGDSFILRNWRITAQGHEKTCQVAFASIVQNASRPKTYGCPVYISCPDPGTGEGGNVLFKLELEANDDHN